MQQDVFAFSLNYGHTKNYLQGWEFERIIIILSQSISVCPEKKEGVGVIFL